MKLVMKINALTFALLAGTAVHAGPATDQAMQRIQAIATGDVGAITAEYGDDAMLQWVGGPLDGAYEGAGIEEIWTKFGKANGTLEAATGTATESGNPNGTTVSIPVTFTGKMTIKVRYTLVYRDNKIVNEIWQIDPNLPAV